MLITNFASGELSPNLNGRVDIQPYYQGAARIENFDIIPTGGIKRRVGTKRLAELSGNNRIIPFIVDKNDVFILELKASNIVIWRRGVTGNYTVVQTLSNAPWTAEQIKQIHYAQNYDTLVMVQRDHTPYELKFNGTTFEGSTMAFDFMADVELDDDFDYVMVVADSTLPVKGTSPAGLVRFTYKKMINNVPTRYDQDFNEGINDYWCIVDGKLYKWEISQFVPYGQDFEMEAGLFTTSSNYPSCVAFFNNRLFFASTDAHPQRVWGSAAPDNYGTRYNDFCTYKKFVTTNRVTKDADLHIFTCDISQADIDTTQHTTVLRNVTQNFTATGTLKAALTKYFVSSGLVPVGTKIISATSNTLTINTDKIAVAWSETHTTETNCVMSIQLWRTMDTASAEDYEYMVVANNVTTADCSLFFELASDQNDAIKFLSSNRFLAVGTESSIWSIDPGISAVNINAVMQGRYGSDDLQGQAVETATVYFAQGKKGIREFYYDGESKAFKTNNIALLDDQILRESAVVDFDYMTNPYARLLLVRENGTLAQMLYDKTNGIMAWSRFNHGKCKIKNCAVTRGYDENDFIFFVVQEGNGVSARYFLELLDLGELTYLDSWKVYDPSVAYLTPPQDPADGYTSGAVLWNKTQDTTCAYDNIPSGFIETGDEVYIGYLYNSYIKSMPVVAGELSQRKRISSLYVRLLDSYLPVVKVTGLADEKFTTIVNLPYSGVAKVNYPGVTDRDVCFELEAGGLKPVNILSVEAQLGQ